jgi:hypothetical protein
MKVLEFLKTNDVHALTDLYGIKVKEYDGVYVLNYDQIESPRGHEIADECRGLIIGKDESGYYLISKCFNRFYNLGEFNNTPESWDGWICEEKADGSLIRIFYHKGRWEIATRGTAYAEAQMMTGSMTFREGVLRALRMDDECFTDWTATRLNPVWTYVFEYTSPMNRIVTRYAGDCMVLLSVFEGEVEKTVEERDQICHSLYHPFIRVPARFDVTSIEDMNIALSTLENLEEGFVFRHSVTNERIKVKSSTYLTCHRIRGDSGVPTVKNIAELVVENETHEFLTYFPEFKDMFDEVQGRWDKMVEDACNLYEQVKDLDSQKEFALAVKGCALSGALFIARRDKCSVSHAIAEMKTSFKVKLLT